MKVPNPLVATVVGGVLAAGLLAPHAHAQGPRLLPAGKPDATINLQTRDGVAAVKGTWRYSDTRIVEVDGQSPDGKPIKTYDYTPHAGAADFDDSAWEALDPTTLKTPRSTGKLCFNWYRIKLTIPEKVGEFSTAGSTAVFETNVADYGEVWVNGKLPAAPGDAGGPTVAGFNTPNRLVIGKDLKPGQTISLAVFGMNGPVSTAPANYIFLRSARLDFYKK